VKFMWNFALNDRSNYGKSVLGVILCICLGNPTYANTISVGNVTSRNICNYFENIYFRQDTASAGAGGFALGPGGLAAAATYASRSRTEFIKFYTKDCYKQFPDAKFALSGVFSGVRAKVPQALVVNVNLSNIGFFSNDNEVSPFGENIQTENSSGIEVRVDYVVTASGRPKMGNSIVVRVPSESLSLLPGSTSRSSSSEEAIYNSIQGEIGREILRDSALRLFPTTVNSVAGRRVLVDNLAPIINSGDIVTVVDPLTLENLEFLVVGQSSEGAVAEFIGEGVVPSSIVGKKIASLRKKNIFEGIKAKIKIPLP
jgi:hypothetical protein